MLVAAIVIASLLGGLGVWAVFRQKHGPEQPVPAVKDAKGGTAAAALDNARVEVANGLVTERLWRLAFAAPSQAQTSEPQHVEIRDAVSAALEAETMDPKHFPRRPTLMPQLLRIVDDPRTATEKISRMVAHDPVLTSDVLRLANSALYRTSSTRIETIQRAIVVLGVDALRGLVATAMLQPVFRATRSNFPRFPRMLWERTGRAVRAAEMHAMNSHPKDRFEAQVVVLLSALGPLVVYGAALDAYSHRPELAPSPALLVALTSELGPQVSLRIARQWDTSPRLIAAMEKDSGESLTLSLSAGELLGTLSLLETQNVITREDALATTWDAGLSEVIVTPILTQLMMS
jgi:HD-like signal output (HDOD) protein